MQIKSTSIILAEVAEKIDHPSINQALYEIELPTKIFSAFKSLFFTVIVRGDNWYPEEHYSIDDTLYISLQFDPALIRSLTKDQTTQMIKSRVAYYVAHIDTVEEREYVEELDQYGDPINAPV